MTTTDTTALPELADLDRRLALVPDEWLTEALIQSAHSAATSRAAARLLAERQATAEARVAQELTALQQGYLAAGVLGAAIEAEMEAQALAAIRPRLHPVAIDPAAAREALDVAHRAMAGHHVELITPSYSDEMVMWKAVCARLGRAVTPPVPSDLDRQAEQAWTTARAQINGWRANISSWMTTAAAGNGDPLDLLAAATSLTEQGAQLAELALSTSNTVTYANRHRRAAGLTWDAAAAQRAPVTA
jgi:hypothetical protein